MEENHARPFPVYDELSYDDYLKNHLIPNTPFILSSRSTSTWSSTTWRMDCCSGPSKPNLKALRRFEDHIVPVANTTTRQYSEFEREERRLGEVLDLWERGDGDGLYVKDWHLFEELEKDGTGVETLYSVPECLQDDWLNPPFTPCLQVPRQPSDGDFRFCYVGPAGTFTPLHRDVYASYSWSANVVGRKIWWFFRPDSLDQVKDEYGELVFDVRELEGEGRGIKVIQEEGEIIFVPSGWHHQVLNLDFCISINHNFFASPTLPKVFDALQAAQTRVEESIKDILPDIQHRLGLSGPWREEWVEEVQGLLERDAGWGWRGFWETVKRNLQTPPAPEGLSPSIEMRNRLVRDVLHRYKALPEYTILAIVQTTVDEIERMVET